MKYLRFLIILTSLGTGCAPSKLPERTFFIKEKNGLARSYELFQSTDTALLVRNVESGTEGERFDAIWMPMDQVDTILFFNTSRTLQTLVGAFAGAAIGGLVGIIGTSARSRQPGINVIGPVEALLFLGSIVGGTIGGAIKNPPLVVYPPMLEDGMFLQRHSLYRYIDEDKQPIPKNIDPISLFIEFINKIF